MGRLRVEHIVHDEAEGHPLADLTIQGAGNIEADARVDEHHIIQARMLAEILRLIGCLVDLARIVERGEPAERPILIVQIGDERMLRVTDRVVSARRRAGLGDLRRQRIEILIADVDANFAVSTEERRLPAISEFAKNPLVPQLGCVTGSPVKSR